MPEQRTTASVVEWEGRGLHSGRPVLLRLFPSAADSGLVFRRIDQGGYPIPVHFRHLEATRLSTSLARNGIRVATVERLLSAIVAIGIDNARIEIDGPEVPILDGSAAPFAQSLLEAGIERQAAPKRFLTILRPIEVSEGDKRLAVFPANDLRATYAIEFPHPLIGYQERGARISPQTFLEELAPARTFCLLRDVERMRQEGLALGGDLSNAVVVGEKGILTGPLRFEDEFVRHKIVDLLGDISLLGHPLRGHLIAYKGGHRLHAAMVQKILQTREAWTLASGHETLAPEILRRFDPLKADVLAGQSATA